MSESNHKALADYRDADIRAAVERRRADDTKIMQKVQMVNREAFTQRFPGMLEHQLRLISERLSNILFKDDHINLKDPTTWPGTPAEIESLSKALWYLEQVRQHWPLDND